MRYLKLGVLLVLLLGVVSASMADWKMNPHTNKLDYYEGRTVYAFTADNTLGSRHLYGATITNTGAGGAIVLTLPTAVRGMHFTVALTVAQDVNINPANLDQIAALTNAKGDAISSAATIGNFISLVAVGDNTWMPVGSSGTWTDVN